MIPEDYQITIPILEPIVKAADSFITLPRRSYQAATELTQRSGRSLAVFLSKAGTKREFKKAFNQLEVSPEIAVIKKAESIYDLADPNTRREISQDLINPKNIQRTSRALLYKLTSKDYKGFKALAALYSKMHVLGWVNAAPLTENRSFGKRFNQDDKAYDLLQEVYRESFDRERLAAPVIQEDMQLADPQPSSEVQVSPAYI